MVATDIFLTKVKALGCTYIVAYSNSIEKCAMKICRRKTVVIRYVHIDEDWSSVRVVFLKYLSETKLNFLLMVFQRLMC